MVTINVSMKTMRALLGGIGCGFGLALIWRDIQEIKRSNQKPKQ